MQCDDSEHSNIQRDFRLPPRSTTKLRTSLFWVITQRVVVISTTRHVITQKSEVIAGILNSKFPLLCSCTSLGHFADVVCAISVLLVLVVVAYVIATHVKQFFRSQSADKWSFA